MTSKKPLLQSKLPAYINDKCKSIVFGYVNLQERKLCLCHIPPIISHLCIQFYFQGEYLEKCTKDLLISNRSMTVTKINKDFAWNNRAFGKTWIESISSSITKWTIKINSIKAWNPTWAHLFVGIVSSEQSTTFCDKTSESPLYLFRGNGTHHRIDMEYQEKDHYEKFGTNDEIRLTLNTIQRKIYLKINQGKSKCIFNNIVKAEEIKYKLVICLFSVGNQITLTDFDCVHY